MYDNLEDLSARIEHIKEYINSELCQKCEDMKQQLNELQQILHSIKNNNNMLSDQ